MGATRANVELAAATGSDSPGELGILEMWRQPSTAMHDLNRKSAVGEDYMTVKDLQELFDYGHWANRRLFDALSQLTEEQFVEPVAGSYGSIRNTLVHMLSAEWGWIDRCGGTPRGPALQATDYPTRSSVRDRWEEVERHVADFLSGKRDEDLDRAVEWAIGGGPKHTHRVGDLLHHAVVHGVHHRGQVALLLRVLGYTPGNFDILFYYERGGPVAVS